MRVVAPVEVVIYLDVEPIEPDLHIVEQHGLVLIECLYLQLRKNPFDLLPLVRPSSQVREGGSAKEN